MSDIIIFNALARANHKLEIMLRTMGESSKPTKGVKDLHNGTWQYTNEQGCLVTTKVKPK